MRVLIEVGAWFLLAFTFMVFGLVLWELVLPALALLLGDA